LGRTAGPKHTFHHGNGAALYLQLVRVEGLGYWTNGVGRIAANSIMFGVYLALSGEDLQSEIGAVKELFERYLKINISMTHAISKCCGIDDGALGLEIGTAMGHDGKSLELHFTEAAVYPKHQNTQGGEGDATAVIEGRAAYLIGAAIIGFAERISRGRWKLTKLREDAVEATKVFHGAIKEYVHAPKTMFTAISCSVFSLILEIAIIYLTFLSIGYPQISWSAVLIISAIFAAVKSIPLGIPFEIGLPEVKRKQ
jgi:hypothetical protein